MEKTSCFNTNCRGGANHRALKKGWQRRSGDLVDLCFSCAATFEQGIFCHAFHLDAAGWRHCESCGKPIHCGCIVSIHDYVLLDAGGVDCITCARKNICKATDQIWPSSLSLPVADIPKDVYVKNWSQIAAPSGNLGHKEKPFNTSAAQSGLNPRMQYEFYGVNQIHECSTSVLETKRLEYPYDRVKDLNHPVMDSPNLNASVDMDIGSHSLQMDEMNQNGLKGVTYKSDRNAHVNISLRPNSLMEGPSNPQFSAVPNLPTNEANGLKGFSATQTQDQTLSPPVVKQSTASTWNGTDSHGETRECIGRFEVDPREQSQLLPRYCPRMTKQELQHISGVSKSVIVPLFEKILSASDAGRIGRLVLPKKCAEAYFPKISPEGLPLKVLDAKGKEWAFHFRFWPNNNSRMYVLEGVAQCIQSMQLQAGDTVTFSRIDPGGKLVMGCRKTGSVPPLDQDNRSLKMKSNVSKISEVNASDPAGSCHINDKHNSFTRRRRNPRGRGAKRKRLGMDDDPIVLNITQEEALGLLHPPVDNPNVVIIEGHAIEEYEDAPILGNRTIVTKDHVGSLCLSAQELASSQLDEIVSSKKTASVSKKTKPAENDIGKIGGPEGLSILASLAVLDTSVPSSIQTTTKQPCHRSGCTCYACIQALIGKGPKHKVTCQCNACLTVKWSKLSPLNRMSKQDTESARKKLEQLQLADDSKLADDLSMTLSSDQSQKVIAREESANVPEDKKPLTPQIDLNIQPEPVREDIQMPVLQSSSIIKLGSGNHKLYPILRGKAGSLCGVNMVVNEKPSEDVGVGNGARGKVDDGLRRDLCSGVYPTCNSKPDFRAADCSKHPSL